MVSTGEVGRRTIEELVTLYQLEPEVRDIFVEGATDRNFLEWHLGDIADGNPLVRAYAVSERVDFPDDLIIEQDMPTGERNRVICLAKSIEIMIPNHRSAIFIVDRDYASLDADAAPTIRGLTYTDFASMEAYAFNDRTLSKLLKVGLGAPASLTGNSVISAISQALISIFIVRLCLRESGTGAKLNTKVLSNWKTDDTAIEHINNVFRICLSQVSATSRNGITQQDLVAQYEAHRAKVGDETRNYIRGHDISYLIVRYLKDFHKSIFSKDGRREYQSPAVLEVLLMTSIEWRDIEIYGLFKSMRDWVYADTLPMDSIYEGGEKGDVL